MPKTKIGQPEPLPPLILGNSFDMWVVEAPYEEPLLNWSKIFCK